MARGNRTYIITWNCESLRAKKHELDILIAEKNPVAICLQDTRLNEVDEDYFKISGYTAYFNSFGTSPSGVAIYVKNSIPQSPVKIITNLQALAVRVTMKGKAYVITSIYIPPSTVPTVQDFDTFISQLKSSSYLLNGDLNAHSLLWGASSTCARGKVTEQILNKYHLIPVNISHNTFLSRAYGTYSLVDLTLAHPSIYLDFQYNVLSSSYSSDHFPVVLELASDNEEDERRPHFNINKANWAGFIRQCKEQLTPGMFADSLLDDKMKIFTDQLIEIATDNIPQTSPNTKQFSKPWFDDECRAAKRERNKAERFYKQHPNISNFIKVKKRQAETRRLFRSKKRKSFRNYVSSLGDKVKARKVWGMIRKLTGKNVPSHLHHLKDSQGNLITDKEEIANTIGETYQNIHSSESYSDDFIRNTKLKEEANPIDFNTTNTHIYNRKFRLKDLKRNIKKAKDSAYGADQVHYQFLKHLPDECLRVLLDLINEYWESHTFPPDWRLALVLPIPKPGKDHFYPTNYRPIALTSCLCKTMERMVNERLIHYLEKNKILTKFQCGFRNDKSTTDQLVRLETYVRDAFIKGQHAVAVFFDLHKAYDTTWKHGILKDLYDMGLRGNLPIFIQNFLSLRSFCVLYGAISSDFYSQEEGVPQGAILSTTLFNIKLNGIVKVILPGVECSLYVDDFVIMFRAKRSSVLIRRLNLCIEKIREWCVANGFTISVGDGKTVAMHFCRNNRSCSTADSDMKLFLGNDTIDYVVKKKFLGLIWDPKLNFKEHIKYLKKKCQSSLNIIKVLAHTDWGASTKTLLKLYRALVRSKLDYGCIVYRNASETDLKTLDVIHNQGIRLCLGAFRSSPVESLYVEANEPPLQERRLELLMKYGLRIKCNRSNPAYDSVFNLQYKELYNHSVHNNRRNVTRPRRRARSLAIDLDELLNESRIDCSKIKPNFISDFPVCYSKDISVNFDLLQYDKSITSDRVYDTLFTDLVKSKFPNYIQFFTDGSKKDDIASFGGYSEYGVFSSRICDFSSIFTAEVEGINRALYHIDGSPTDNGKFVIFCDSKSVLESIQSQNTRNVLIKEIIDYIHTILFTSHKRIRFCWIPSHRGIKGNVKADQAAGRARGRTLPEHYQLPYTDLYPVVETFIRGKWQKRWIDADSARPNKLFSIQPIIGSFDTSGLSRKEETIIHRLRIGHTRLTHRYLMEQTGPFKTPELCQFCMNGVDFLSVRHILINCTGIYYTRRDFFITNSMRHLFENIPLSRILDFLKHIEIYKHI